MLFPVSHPPDRQHRVVVTGAGIITSLGTGWPTNAEAFRLGKVGIRAATLIDVSRQRVKVAGEVDLPEETGGGSRLEPFDRAGRMLAAAGREAWKQADWKPAEYLPLVLGTTSGGMTLGQDFYRQAVQAPGNEHGQLKRLSHYQPQRQGLDLAEDLGVGGPLTIVANACASGANALGHAWEMVRSGRAERVLTGGYDALSQLVFAGFDSLQALSPTQCRPFDAERDGLALGEGAAVMAFESLESARKRGAIILGEVVGYGAATDLHHLTQPHPGGDAALNAMKTACAAAGVGPEKIGYINAHGTGTPLNDSAEALAINRWAGVAARSTAVSSTKSGIGHLLGAAGAVEAAVCLMALQGQWLPPTSTIRRQDPVCEFRVVREPEDCRLEYALTNSFGFGGANASLVFRRFA